MPKTLSLRALTLEEHKELKRLIRTCRDARVVRRAQMVQLFSEGKTTAEIGALWAITAQGVRKVLNRFNRKGLAGLVDRPRGGRPRKTNDRYVELLKEAVQANPRDMGYIFSCWTLERLREHLARKTRVILSVTHLSRLLAEHNIVYRRPKNWGGHGMSHLRDPQEYDEKKAFLEFIKKKPNSPTPPSTCSTSMSVRFTSTRP
jgi:transposase